jgi:hypothetical protein
MADKVKGTVDQVITRAHFEPAATCFAAGCNGSFKGGKVIGQPVSLPPEFGQPEHPVRNVRQPDRTDNLICSGPGIICGGKVISTTSHQEAHGNQEYAKQGKDPEIFH